METWIFTEQKDKHCNVFNKKENGKQIIFYPSTQEVASQEENIKIFLTQKSVVHNYFCKELEISYDAHIFIKEQIKQNHMPDEIIFPKGNAMAYFTLMDYFLYPDFYKACKIRIHEGEVQSSSEPEYVLPYWWIKKLDDLCFNAQNSKEYPFITNKEQTKIPIDIDTGKKDLLSIIIPFYNAQATLAQTLKSAYDSDYSFKEIIVVNDGSTEDLASEVLSQMQNLYPDLIVVNKENGGPASARNTGILNAKGEFLVFLDADDIIEPQFYSEAIELLHRYPKAGYISSWMQLFGQANRIVPYFPSCLPLLLIDNMQCVGCVCRSALVRLVGGNSEDMHGAFEDYEMWIKLAENGYFGINIPKLYYNYRIAAGSMSTRFSADSSHYRQIELCSILEKKHPELYKEYSKEIFNLLTANGPGYIWQGPAFVHSPVEYEQQNDEQLRELSEGKAYYEKQFQLAREDANNYKNSFSYKLGNKILHPFSKNKA